VGGDSVKRTKKIRTIWTEEDERDNELMGESDDDDGGGKDEASRSGGGRRSGARQTK
jgi:hypothetical protein